MNLAMTVQQRLGLALRRTVLPAILAASSIVDVSAASLPAPLLLQDFGSFFVNNSIINSDFPSAPATGVPVGGRISVNGMYVQYMIPYAPFGRPKTPVMMVHGSGHTGKTYETTPDGREGWATYFVRHGHPVYVVDQSGRARSGFDPTSVNQAKVQGNAALLPQGFTTFSHVQAWATFRFGPTPDVWWPDTRFPTAYLDQYQAQLVPNTESSLVGGGNPNNVNAMVALLDKIGPMIVMVHSQSGVYGALTSISRPNLVKAFVDVEGTAGCQLTQAQINILAQVPTIVVAGDHGWPGESSCRPTVAALNAAGGNATFYATYEHGMPGHTHMMMLDFGNLEIAQAILDWLDGNAKP